MIDEIPDDISTDMRNLTPARGKLARIHAWKNREVDALGLLVAGRGKLADRISDAETALAKQAAELDAEVAGIVENIRRGVDFIVSFVRAPRETVIDLTLGKAALAKADEAIAEKHALIQNIANLIPAAVEACLIEEAGKHAETYRNSLTAAADAASQLEGLHVALGRGRSSRIVLQAPGFGLAGDEAEVRPVPVHAGGIKDAETKWRRFAEALSWDARADAGKLLKFAPRNADAGETITYDQMTPPERRLIDIRNAR